MSTFSVSDLMRKWPIFWHIAGTDVPWGGRLRHYATSSLGITQLEAMASSHLMVAHAAGGFWKPCWMA